jgi:hypothetical protein
MRRRAHTASKQLSSRTPAMTMTMTTTATATATKTTERENWQGERKSADNVRYKPTLHSTCTYTCTCISKRPVQVQRLRQSDVDVFSAKPHPLSCIISAAVNSLPAGRTCLPPSTTHPLLQIRRFPALPSAARAVPHYQPACQRIDFPAEADVTHLIHLLSSRAKKPRDSPTTSAWLQPRPASTLSS